MLNEQRSLKVFLCHAHSDKSAVRDLYFRLTGDHVVAWLDKENLLPGQDWEYEIRKAVREADVVVVCLSKQFNQAGFRQKEVRLALDTAMEQPEGEIFIIPARLEECDALESLRKWHWVDLFEDDGYEMLMRALRARANRIGATLQVRRSWLPKVTTPRKSEKLISERKATEAKRAPAKSERKSGETVRPKAEKPKPPKTKVQQKSNTAIIVALIGFAGVIIAGLISSPLIEGWFSPVPTANATATLRNTEVVPTNTLQPMRTSFPTKNPEPSPTPTTEFGFNLVYISEQDEKRSLYNLDSEGKKKELLTTDDFSYIGGPVLSPEGNLVAIETDKGIYTVDLHTGSSQELSSFGVKPVWRPDGLEMAFETGDPTTESIELCNWEAKKYGYGTPYCASTYASSKSNLKLYFLSFVDENPEWISNAFTAYYGTTSSAWNKLGSKFALIKRDGVDYLCAFKYPTGFWETGFTDNGQCTWTSDHIETFDWSPSGDQIVFSAQSAQNGSSNVYLFKLSDSSKISLTSDPSNNSSPIWSHTGGRIAFVSDRDGNQEIYVMNIPDLSFENITQNSSNDFSPVWSPDGKGIVFVSDRSGDLGIFLIDIETHKTIGLTDDAGNQFSPVIVNTNP